MRTEKRCRLCGSDKLKPAAVISKRPDKETDFGISPKHYRREIKLCLDCDVYNNFNDYDFDKIYSQKYNQATYGGQLQRRYKTVMNLPMSKSDNKQRVKRVADFCEAEGMDLKNTRVLDVGSGLCVFLGEFSKYGIKGYCIDPDPLAIKHAISNVDLSGAYAGLFSNYQTDLKFDVISFNNVLEHVTDPVSLLKKAKTHLKEKGIIYIELPDGENALKNNDLVRREEFYIEHYTVFTKKSFKKLNDLAGLITIKLESIFEPSKKHTIHSFARGKGLMEKCT